MEKPKSNFLEEIDAILSGQASDYSPTERELEDMYSGTKTVPKVLDVQVVDDKKDSDLDSVDK